MFLLHHSNNVISITLLSCTLYFALRYHLYFFFFFIFEQIYIQLLITTVLHYPDPSEVPSEQQQSASDLWAPCGCSPVTFRSPGVVLSHVCRFIVPPPVCAERDISRSECSAEQVHMQDTSVVTPYQRRRTRITPIWILVLSINCSLTMVETPHEEARGHVCVCVCV